jgi:hypothetical protein
MKPRNAAPINLDKCHRPFGQLSDTTPARYRSVTNAMNVEVGKRGIARANPEIGLSFGTRLMQLKPKNWRSRT